MEFLKHNWGYFVLAAAVVAVIAVTWYLLVWAGNDNSYAGGMLVRAVQGTKEMARL